ncbi:MAG: hypothetical protein DRH17_00870 [Deltaproteobacteria bacterium]|nr:MAG: hypothetical protein DRH17_00870 [Deltaproteobacteria bacterium]
MTDFKLIESLDEIPLNARLCLYGAGGFCQHLLKRLSVDRPDIKVPFLVDSFKTGKIFGLDLVKPQSLVEEKKHDYDFILITAGRVSRSAILSMLKSLGIKNVMVGSDNLQSQSSILNTLEGRFEFNFSKDIVKLNLGGGSHWRRTGWYNLDFGQGGYDLSTNFLSPFSDNSIEKIYTSHTLEHLRPDKCYLLIKDCYRVLKKKAIFRITVPDCEIFIRAFYNGENELLFKGQQQYFDSPIDQIQHMGGNPDGLHLKSKIGHYFFWDKYTLSWLLIMAGFRKISVVNFGESADPEMCEIGVIDEFGHLIDGFDNPGVSRESLYLEAQK